MIRETFVDGELVESVEVPDDPTPPPTAEDRIAELEQTVETLLALLEG